MNFRRAFTMIELLLAVMMVGVITAFITMTFSAITNGWAVSADYVDKLARADYALERITAALKSCYYPHLGSQDDKYGFYLEDNGDGTRADKSDVISWRTKSHDAVSSTDAMADTVYRIYLMMLEEGDNDYAVPITKTGLYARAIVDEEIAVDRTEDEDDMTIGNKELFPPYLISDSVAGFNCRVMKEPTTRDTRNARNDESAFQDKFDISNAVPYKVELTFYLADNDEKKRNRETAPIVKIVKLPLYEQSLTGAETPASESKNGGKTGGGGRGGAAK